MSSQNWLTDLGLVGKGALVTGAAGGIGREVAIALASAGARVAVVDIDSSACERVVLELDRPEEHVAIGADLTDLSLHDDLVNRTLDRLGRLDILACLAAVLRRRSTIDEVTEEDWDVQFNINLKSLFFLNRTVAR